MGIRTRGGLPDTFLEHYFPALLGDRAVGYFYFSGVVVDDETLVVGGRTYEFSDDGTVTNAAYVPVDVSAGLTAAIASAALVTAINGDSYMGATAYLLTGDVVGIVGDDEARMGLTSSGTTNVSRSAAAMVIGAAEAAYYEATDEYTFTTQDATTMAAGGYVICGAFVTAAGAPKFKGQPLFRNSSDQLLASTLTSAQIVVEWVQVSGYLYALLAYDAAAIIANGDKMAWTAIG